MINFNFDIEPGVQNHIKHFDREKNSDFFFSYVHIPTGLLAFLGDSYICHLGVKL